MIKINLLAGEKAKKTKGAVVSVAPVATGEAGPVPMAGLLSIIIIFAVISLGLFGWYYFQNAQLERKIKEQQAELKKYEEAKKRVEELNKKKSEFQAKLDKIQELKKNQRIPVLLMNKLMDVLPEGVWYTSIGSAKDGLKVEGKARGLKTISTFYDNAVTIPDFVGAEKGMGGIKQESQENDIYNFSMTFNFIPGGPQKQTTETKAAKPTKGGKSAPAKQAAPKGNQNEVSLSNVPRIDGILAG